MLIWTVFCKQWWIHICELWTPLRRAHYSSMEREYDIAIRFNNGMYICAPDMQYLLRKGTHPGQIQSQNRPPQSCCRESNTFQPGFCEVLHRIPNGHQTSNGRTRNSAYHRRRLAVKKSISQHSNTCALRANPVVPSPQCPVLLTDALETKPLFQTCNAHCPTLQQVYPDLA